jgi:hypothetical protein
MIKRWEQFNESNGEKFTKEDVAEIAKSIVESGVNEIFYNVQSGVSEKYGVKVTGDISPMLNMKLNDLQDRLVDIISTQVIGAVSIKESADTKKSLGINFESEFSEEDREIIEEGVLERIATQVEQGFTSGELIGEEPSFRGWFEVNIQEDTNDEDIRNQEVAKLIREGNVQGYYPHFTWTANVWK